jgi:cell division protein FtsI/penicillin-binding protein 2
MSFRRASAVFRRMYSSGAVPRRVLLFGAVVVLLGIAGLVPLAWAWSGARGRAPADRLYLPVRFDQDAALLTMKRAHARPDDPEAACYAVHHPGEESPATRVCPGGRSTVWVGDALVEVAVSEGQIPSISVAGARFDEGEWIGSDAGPEIESLDTPLRGYGIPARAAQVVACDSATVRVGRPAPAGCIRVHDRLGRLALARSTAPEPGDDPALLYGKTYPLRPGDELWLGLVVFAVEAQRAPDGTRLGLRRRGRAQPEPDSLIRAAVGRGGDRRWLGRLWPVEFPDAAGRTGDEYVVYPLQVRYSRENLSRQRTNLEAEDILQRLVDAELLCLEGAPGAQQVRWRPLDRPGCARGAADHVVALGSEVMEDYQRARFGDAASMVADLIGRTNRLMERYEYLDDATALPLAFSWTLARWSPSDPGAPDAGGTQPVPQRLWGVRFGATRVTRGSLERQEPVLPELHLSGTTARHVIEVRRGAELLATLALGSRSAGPRGRGGDLRQGVVCLGSYPRGAAPERVTRTSGTHHLLGVLAFHDDPRVAEWYPAAPGGCGGCELRFRTDASAKLRVLSGAGCAGRVRGGAPDAGGGVLLGSGEALDWSGSTGPLRFVHHDRGARPWAVFTHPRTGRRAFAREFYQRGGLAPLLGDRTGLQGVEAAMREWARTMADSLPRDPLELSVDGDLQLAVQSIVDAHDLALQDGADPSRPPVTVAVLDAATGALLAAANGPAPVGRRAGRLTAWEAGAAVSGQAGETALMRRRAVGSTIKVVGGYALANQGLRRGDDPVGRQAGFVEYEATDGDRGVMYIARAGTSRIGNRVRRQCTGTHLVPVTDEAFTDSLFTRRFARSCNSFFITTGFRHASAAPARVGPGPSLPGVGELRMDATHRDSLTLVEPRDQALSDRIRDGLAADFEPGRADPPRSIFGLLVRSGFHLDPGDGVASDGLTRLEMEHAGGSVEVPFVGGWFASGRGLPALAAGRDFSYPAVLSPGRLDERTARGAPAAERYDSERQPDVRFDPGDGTPGVQYAMTLIGQAHVTASALGLAVLYAPTARTDGRTVSPCLFSAGCGSGRAGHRVLDTRGAGASVLQSALRAVVAKGGTANQLLPGARAGVAERWGGKTGTYQWELSDWPAWLGSQETWLDLVDYACGVQGVRPPHADALAGALRASGREGLVQALAHPSAAGSAAGARICETRSHPLNPGGIHRYRLGPGSASLDTLAAVVRRARAGVRRKKVDYHAMVLVALPPRNGHPSPAAGIVVSVLVDHEANQAVPIAAEVAGAVERWARIERAR